MWNRLVKTLQEDLQTLKAALGTFSEREMMTHAAALAYYMVFSFPPMMFIVLWIASQFYQGVAMHTALTGELDELVGAEGAQQLMATIEGPDLREPTFLASAVGIGAMLLTATTVLVTARNALNRLAGTKAAKKGQGGVVKFLRERIVSFAMLATLAFILLVSLVLDALVASLGNLIAEWDSGLASLLTTFDALLLDIGAATVLIAMFVRFLPDKAPPWRDIWAGSFLSALVLAAGQNVLGTIVSGNNTADLYAAAGSVLVLMLWVYYASAIFLFGATFAFGRAARRERELSGADDHDRDPGPRPDSARNGSAGQRRSDEKGSRRCDV